MDDPILKIKALMAKYPELLKPKDRGLRPFSYDEVYVDILRKVINRSLDLPIIILICGHGQIGKSTFVFYLANRIIQLKKGIKIQDATWQEWDWKNLSTTTPQAFVDIHDNNDGAIINLSEAGEQMNYLEWFGTMSSVFLSTTNTQGYHMNICILDTPKANDISKHNKESVDFKLWIVYRNKKHKFVKVRPRDVGINYLKDKPFLKWLPDWDITYTDKFLKESNKFTEWLKIYKKEIANKNKEKIKESLAKAKDKAEQKKEMQRLENMELPKEPIKLKWW